MEIVIFDFKVFKFDANIALSAYIENSEKLPRIKEVFSQSTLADMKEKGFIFVDKTIELTNTMLSINIVF